MNEMPRLTNVLIKMSRVCRLLLLSPPPPPPPPTPPPPPPPFPPPLVCVESRRVLLWYHQLIVDKAQNRATNIVQFWGYRNFSITCHWSVCMPCLFVHCLLSPPHGVGLKRRKSSMWTNVPMLNSRESFFSTSFPFPPHSHLPLPVSS